MALKLTKEIFVSFKDDEIMKDNCVCINGTCTTKYNTCQFESPLVCSSMA